MLSLLLYLFQNRISVKGGGIFFFSFLEKKFNFNLWEEEVSKWKEARKGVMFTGQRYINLLSSRLDKSFFFCFFLDLLKCIVWTGLVSGRWFSTHLFFLSFSPMYISNPTLFPLPPLTLLITPYPYPNTHNFFFSFFLGPQLIMCVFSFFLYVAIHIFLHTYKYVIN